MEDAHAREIETTDYTDDEAEYDNAALLARMEEVLKGKTETEDKESDEAFISDRLKYIKRVWYVNYATFLFHGALSVVMLLLMKKAYESLTLFTDGQEDKYNSEFVLAVVMGTALGFAFSACAEKAIKAVMSVFSGEKEHRADLLLMRLYLKNDRLAREVEELNRTRR